MLLRRVAGPAIFGLAMWGLFVAISTLAAPLMDAADGLVMSFGGRVAGFMGEELLHDLWLDGIVAGLGGEVIFAPQIAFMPILLAVLPPGREERAIPIQADLAAILKAYRAPSGFILVPKRPMPERGGQKHTYRYDPQAIWNRINRTIVEQGGKRISPHGMRHSFASNLLMAGVSDVLVARWLGQADTSMVHERYGHLLAYHGDINKMKITP